LRYQIPRSYEILDFSSIDYERIEIVENVFGNSFLKLRFGLDDKVDNHFCNAIYFESNDKIFTSLKINSIRMELIFFFKEQYCLGLQISMLSKWTKSASFFLGPHQCYQLTQRSLICLSTCDQRNLLWFSIYTEFIFETLLPYHDYSSHNQVFSNIQIDLIWVIFPSPNTAQFYYHVDMFDTFIVRHVWDKCPVSIRQVLDTPWPCYN